MTFSKTYDSLTPANRREFRRELIKCAGITEGHFYRIKNKLDGKSAIAYIANILIMKYE